eukprot:CAMPEP_0202691184 /NCGR_PEP_ID=MMETSP1385-20130828/5973_1 /ASSEMBLY_ACC=CAM_ASM_000861 /TAXON_ID=933848 /ORGANISM="Elphidium margaritaceum" /LENGTH=60 /DNA_ID=CAMNT_0049346551 /DNA_START=200 /DNA_END=382 /DNA_ORIENTATION=-
MICPCWSGFVFALVHYACVDPPISKMHPRGCTTGITQLDAQDVFCVLHDESFMRSFEVPD